MKKTFLMIVLIAITGLFACTDDDEPDKKTINETISMGASYANDIYYSLSNGVVATVSRTEWDIAFAVGAMSSSILINESAGVELKVSPTTAGWSWADNTDTTGHSSRMALYNGDEDWEEGAFGANATGHPNYGWGEYDMNTHNITGVALYIIKTKTGNYKKIWIENKQSADQVYNFKFANIDGTGEQSIALDVSASTANFVYYDLDGNARLDREPDASTWDILFTKWLDNSIYYPVTGVLQNIDVMALEVEGDPLNDIYTLVDFDDDINEIGSDWKSFSMELMQYELDEDKYFFVKDKNENIYKIFFTAFAGSESGDISFDITNL